MVFDTIDHHILLDQLHISFRICNTVLDCLPSYLDNWKQFICLDHSHSTTTTCTTSVPQGSVLGPILFSLLVSSIAQIATKYGVHQQQYIDDTQLYISISRNNTSQLHDLEGCLLSLSSRFFHNFLSLNPAKINAVLFGTIQSAKSLSNISKYMSLVNREHCLKSNYSVLCSIVI